MSAFIDALASLMAREFAAKDAAERGRIREERTELLRANHRGEFYERPEEPLPAPLSVDELPHDGRAAAAGKDAE